MSELNGTSRVRNTAPKRFDLVKRTKVYAREIVKFCKSIPRHPVNDRLSLQLLDAGTSVGANYHEADDASSPRDYRHKVAICRKESKESMFWLQLIRSTELKMRDPDATLWLESRELNSIFGKIIRTMDAKVAKSPP